MKNTSIFFLILTTSIILAESMKPNKVYTMVCDNKIVDINLATNERKVLYDPNKIRLKNKPLFNMGINYCKINNKLYLSTGLTFEFDLEKKFLSQSVDIEGDLQGCIKDKQLIYYKKNDRFVYEYSLETNKSTFIYELKKNWLGYYEGISIVDNKFIFFNDNEKVLKYDINKKTVVNTTISNCDIVEVAINAGDKLLCKSTDLNNIYLFLFDLNTKNTKKIINSKIETKDIFYDKELNGFFYTRYDWDFFMFKEYRPTKFYSLEKEKEYSVIKDCHF
jgi:hypothetical protein